MSEVLEGVLSEAMLDELASDLGIEANVLRKHPFFRVLKGRVLLTYPLRVQGFVLGDIKQTAPFNLAAGAMAIIPTGRIVVAVTTGDTIATALTFELLVGAAWMALDYVDGSGRWEPRATDAIQAVPILVKSNGTDVAIANRYGSGSNDDIVYFYMEAE